MKKQLQICDYCGDTVDVSGLDIYETHYWSVEFYSVHTKGRFGSPESFEACYYCAEKLKPKKKVEDDKLQTPPSRL